MRDLFYLVAALTLFFFATDPQRVGKWAAKVSASYQTEKAKPHD